MSDLTLFPNRNIIIRFGVSHRYFIPDWNLAMWKMLPADEYIRQYKQFEKKRPRELEAVLANLQRYFEALLTQTEDIAHAKHYAKKITEFREVDPERQTTEDVQQRGGDGAGLDGGQSAVE